MSPEEMFPKETGYRNRINKNKQVLLLLGKIYLYKLETRDRTVRMPAHLSYGSLTSNQSAIIKLATVS